MAGGEDMTNPESQKFNIGPSEQDIRKFQIGDTGEDIKKHLGPESRTQMPDIRMQAGADDEIQRRHDDERRLREGEHYLREQDPYYGLNRNFQRLIRTLETLPRLENGLRQLKQNATDGSLTEDQKKRFDELAGQQEKEVEKTRETLSVYYERLMTHTLLDISLELDEEYLRLRNPVPFETRSEDYYFKNLRRGIQTALLEEDWAKPDSDEARFWLYQADKDLLTVGAWRELGKGMAAGLDKFFDWELILQQVKERYKEDPRSNAYELTFKRDYRGPKLPETRKEGNIDIEILEASKKERLALRERTVDYHADYRFWSMAVAAVHQMEYINETTSRTPMGKMEPRGTTEQEGGKWEETLIQAEKDFIQLMFGTGENGEWATIDEDGNLLTSYGEDENQWAIYQEHRFPHKMLNFPVMGSTQVNKERYILIMSELLKRKIRKEFKDGKYQSRDDQITLVKDIKEKVEARRKVFYTPNVSFDELLPETVIKLGIVLDWGHKATVNLGWGYNYDDKGTRKFDSGATTVAGDITTGAWWRENKRASAFVKGWSSGPLPDMSEGYVAMLKNKPPDYKPKLKDMSEKAAITQEERDKDRLINKSYKRLEDAIKKANPALWPYLEKMVWYWETPYVDRDGRNLVLPVWTPPVIDSINYWNTIAWDPKLKIKDKIELDQGGNPKTIPGAPTVWEGLQAGEDLAEKDWSEVDGSLLADQAYYRHLVTIGQIHRILEIINSKPELVMQEFATFFEESKRLDELRKRGDLAFRDEVIPIAIINMSLAPLLIVTATAKKKDIISIKGKSPRELGEWVAGDLEEWRRVIRRSTPEEREDIKGYRDAMLAFFDFYYTQFVLVAYRMGQSVVGEETATEKYLTKIVEDDTGVKVEYITPSGQAEARLR